MEIAQEGLVLYNKPLITSAYSTENRTSLGPGLAWCKPILEPFLFSLSIYFRLNGEVFFSAEMDF